jgi:acetoin:2,6-dichlorophenolindophenol oxidoreductase subunit alpha
VDLTKEQLLRMYRLMVRIRLFEEKLVQMFAEGTMPGLAHLYVGEEAAAVGTCSAIRQDDYITSTHRGHGHLIAKGGQTDRMMAELFGRANGYCKGKGGSMHIADLDLGVLGAMGIVGSGVPIAVGAGMSAKLRGTDQICVCFFGDAASNIGAAHEGLNLAGVWKAPVVFVCENNGYGISVSQKQHQAITNVADRAIGYGMPSVVIDGNDVLAVYEAVSEAARRARAGNGPTLVEAKTYRWRGHFEGDPGRGIRYRPAAEMEEWLGKCPIKRYGARLIEMGTASEDELRAIQEEVADEIAAAVEFAKSSPFPEPDDAKVDVYSPAFAYVVDPALK